MQQVGGTKISPNTVTKNSGLCHTNGDFPACNLLPKCTPAIHQITDRTGQHLVMLVEQRLSVIYDYFYGNIFLILKARLAIRPLNFVS